MSLLPSPPLSLSLSDNDKEPHLVIAQSLHAYLLTPLQVIYHLHSVLHYAVTLPTRPRVSSSIRSRAVVGDEVP